MRFESLVIFILAFALMLVSCRKDEVQAEQSIEGQWLVKSIISKYGAFSNSTFISSDQIEEDMVFGMFNFSNEEVDFEFTRNDTLYSNTAAWNLTSEKVNAGFTKVREYTLDIENNFTFKVFFEDGTSNSEKNATLMTLTQNPTVTYPVLISMELEKI